VAAFRKGLSEAGYFEGRNVAIEYRWGQNDNDRLPELAADLVRRGVSLIATAESTETTRIVKAATTTIPIVFVAGADPVQTGLVGSLSRPGGNATGVIHMNIALGAKRLGLLHEMVPKATPVAVLLPNLQPYTTDNVVPDLQTAASALNVQIEIFPVATAHEIDAAFVGLLQKQAKALVVFPHALFTSRRVQILTLATRHGLPAIYPWREDAVAGGLVSYGPSITDQFRQAGIYAARILKGERPAELPVIRATKFEFIINVQTARTLGIEVPPNLLALADEVIE
jgi:putative tryptophan/tyrosine transport system substrate-binding protein